MRQSVRYSMINNLTQIRFVWQKKWTLTKWLFLLNRYLGFVLLLYVPLEASPVNLG
jgi:hypothetical protein